MTISILKDLRGHFTEARDQGERPTCIAFAASDLHASTRPKPFSLLSVEYLYFHAVGKNPKGDPHGGASLLSISSAMNDDGQPFEKDWPYIPKLPKDLATWTPPNKIPTFKAKLSQSKSDIQYITNTIDSDKAVMITLFLTQQFFAPNTEGVVELINGEPRIACHSVLCLGHGTLDGAHAVLIRNSWGRKWGIDGNAWIYDDYLANHILTASTIL